MELYMARVETGLSSATLLAACMMLCGAFFQMQKIKQENKQKNYHGLQLSVCAVLLCLAIGRVVLSALHLRRIAGEVMATVYDILTCLSLTGPPIFEASGMLVLVSTC